MKNQMVVTPQIHRPIRDDIPHVLGQLLTVDEGVTHAIHAQLLFRRKCVRVGWVDCREQRVPQGIGYAIDHDGPAAMIDRMQQPSVVQMPLGIPSHHRAFEFELHDRHGLLHPCDDRVRPHAAGLGHEMLGGIIGIDRPRQML